MAAGERASFRILGTFEVRLGDQPVPLPRPAVWRLFAALVLSGDQSVGADHLVELAFGPAGASRSNVQVCVSRLRRWLADHVAGCATVERDGPGYLLIPARASVDARQFAALASAPAADNAERLHNLTAALRVWRGSVLADMPGWIQSAPEAIHLGRQRADRACELANLALEAGQPEIALPLVEPLAADQRFDEPLLAALLRLLGGSGRRAVALRQFEESRRMLAEELGVDPSPVLRQAYLELLRENAQTPAQDPPALLRSVPAPSELPPDLGTFTGRSSELAQLNALLSQPSDELAMVVAIGGPGGIGKSALAIHAAHALVEHFPGGQLYVNLNGATSGVSPLTSLEVLGRFLRSLGVAGAHVPSGLDEAAARYRSLLADQRMLIVLDDAADAEQVRPLIPTGPGNRVLVTSRRVLSVLENMTYVQLGALSEGEVVALLGRLAGQERVAADQAAAVEVGRLCGYLPLAVRIAGARLSARPDWAVSGLAKRLTDSRRRLDELEHADVGLRASFTVSYQGLDAVAARLFRLVGVIDIRDFAAWTAAVAADLTLDEAEQALDHLMRAQMLDSVVPGRYRMHDLIRLFAADRAEAEEPEAVRRAAVLRVLHWYLATARRATLLLDPSYAHAVNSVVPQADGLRLADLAEAATWIDTEIHNLAVACEQAQTMADQSQLVIDLAIAARRSVLLRGFHDEAISLDRHALEAADCLGRLPAQARALTCLGESYLFAHESASAVDYLVGAVAAWSELGDRHAEAEALARLGMVWTDLNDYEQAAACYERSVAIWADLREPDQNTAALVGYGLLLQQQGAYHAALQPYQEALTLARAAGKIRTAGIALGNMGEVHRRVGNSAEAITHLTEALEIVRSIGEKPAEAEYLWELGEVLYSVGRGELSRHCQEQSAEILVTLGKITVAEAGEMLRAWTPDKR